MLKDRISTLFALLQCSNSDIARYAGCAQSNISRLRSGTRTPKANSRPTAKLTEGVYLYAENEALLPTLAELVRAEDTTQKSVVPALITWLYDEGEIHLPHTAAPKSKRVRALKKQTFGVKLNRIMVLLDLSNAQLAKQLNVDDSLISLYRKKGHVPPSSHARLSELSEALYIRAKKKAKLRALAKLCSIPLSDLNAVSLQAWLDSVDEKSPSEIAENFLLSLDSLHPVPGMPPVLPEPPDTPEESCYFGLKGLRQAVIRLLSNAAQTGGELLLFSDEPMKWMSRDKKFFSLWAALMLSCLHSGVQIRIIHNMNRNPAEMADAIKGWFPLYIAGQITPYVFRQPQNQRFFHTLFLHSGTACIFGYIPASAKEQTRWYEYITDKKRLNAIHKAYSDMLARDAQPFLKTYRTPQREEYFEWFNRKMTTESFLLSGLPVVTMPDTLLERILSRTELDHARQTALLSFYQRQQELFMNLIEKKAVDLILHLPDQSLADEGMPVNFSPELVDLEITYQKEEYEKHLAAFDLLLKEKPNLHLTLLSFSPFQDIQLIIKKDAVSVLRSGKPYGAFVFLNPMLTQSVRDYLDTLKTEYGEPVSSFN